MKPTYSLLSFSCLVQIQANVDLQQNVTRITDDTFKRDKDTKHPYLKCRVRSVHVPPCEDPHLVM